MFRPIEVPNEFDMDLISPGVVLRPIPLRFQATRKWWNVLQSSKRHCEVGQMCVRIDLACEMSVNDDVATQTLITPPFCARPMLQIISLRWPHEAAFFELQDSKQSQHLTICPPMSFSYGSRGDGMQKRMMPCLLCGQFINEQHYIVPKRWCPEDDDYDHDNDLHVHHQRQLHIGCAAFLFYAEYPHCACTVHASLRSQSQPRLVI